jgi:hypothetical protein
MSRVVGSRRLRGNRLLLRDPTEQHGADRQGEAWTARPEARELLLEQRPS